MKISDFSRYGLGIGAGIAMLAGCGGSQVPMGPVSGKDAAVMRQALLTDQPTGTHHFRAFYTFESGTDGANPRAGLVALNGTLYGTTGIGGGYCGSTGCGTIFSVSTSGQEKVLYSFKGGNADGFLPSAALVAVNGVLYGTTTYGGTGCQHYGGGGCGTVFSVTTVGAEKILHLFTAGADGGEPSANLVAVGGLLYGTTELGGCGQCNGCNDGQLFPGCGTVFSVSASGKEKVLYSFMGGTDGIVPIAGLVVVKGVFYGATINGGAYGYGTVFSATASGQEKVLYSFKGGTDGDRPWGGMIYLNGNLYGTTVSGGTGCGSGPGCGTVYSISTSGKEKVLYRFKGASDGAGPAASLIAVKGVLYGSTQFGGTYPCDGGTVFSITTSGQEKMLRRLNCGTDGAFPWALIDLNGVLYGTSFGGVTDNLYGTVFRLLP